MYILVYLFIFYLQFFILKMYKTGPKDEVFKKKKSPSNITVHFSLNGTQTVTLIKKTKIQNWVEFCALDISSPLKQQVDVWWSLTIGRSLFRKQPPQKLQNREMGL